MEGKWQADKLKLELTAEGEGGADDDDYADDDGDNDEDFADDAEKSILEGKIDMLVNCFIAIFLQAGRLPIRLEQLNHQEYGICALTWLTP